MSILAILLLLIFSLIMAAGDKHTKPYPLRVFHCATALIILFIIISWFIFLPIIGLLSLFLI